MAHLYTATTETLRGTKTRENNSPWLFLIDHSLNTSSGPAVGIYFAETGWKICGRRRDISQLWMGALNHSTQQLNEISELTGIDFVTHTVGANKN